MNTKNIIQQGESAKFQIENAREGFSMLDNDFRVRLYWGMQGRTLDIAKKDMLQDEDGRFYIQFDTKNMSGLVKVETTYDVPDADFSSEVRPEIERQPLCYVNPVDKLPVYGGAGDGYIFAGNHVTFNRTSASGVKSLYFILRDIVGKYLKDALGRQLRARKTERI